MSFLKKVFRSFRERWGVSSSPGADDPVARSDTDRTGLWGETVAAQFLEAKGMRIVARRVKIHRDEIDLVASDPVRGTRLLVFVEVKTRTSDRYGGGRAAVNARKRHALCRAAAHYLRRQPRTPFRFDVVEVIGREQTASPPVIRHFEQAFPMETRFVHGALHGRPLRQPRMKTV